MRLTSLAGVSHLALSADDGRLAHAVDRLHEDLVLVEDRHVIDYEFATGRVADQAGRHLTVIVQWPVADTVVKPFAVVFPPRHRLFITRTDSSSSSSSSCEKLIPRLHDQANIKQIQNTRARRVL